MGRERPRPHQHRRVLRLRRGAAAARLPWAGALFVGGTLTLLMFGASVFVATQTETRHPRAWAFAAGLALAVPVLLAPRAVLGAFARVAVALFGPGR